MNPETLSSKVIPASIMGLAVAVAAILVSTGFIQSPQETLVKELALERRLAGMESQLQRIADNMENQRPWTMKDMESWVYRMEARNPTIIFIAPDLGSARVK